MVSAMGESRRTTRSVELIALCAGLLLSTAACTAADPASPSPTASVADADDAAEAAVLAEAIDAYTRYSAALDVVLAEGDGDYSKLADFTTPAFLTRLSEDDIFAVNGWTTTGSTTFDSEEYLSEVDSTVTVRLCRDVSRVRVENTAGEDVTPTERADRFVVTVAFVRDDERTLLVDSSERDGEDRSCER
jgi:hypothetical protein